MGSDVCGEVVIQPLIHLHTGCPCQYQDHMTIHLSVEALLQTPVIECNGI